MNIFRSLEEISSQSGPSTVTIGSFDGIHRAHQELLRRIRERAAERGSRSVAITFDPHPLAVVAPEKAPRLLTPLPVKLELLANSGADELLILPFTREFSRWSPEHFVEQVLVKTLHAECVLVGENFRFGHRQAGTPQRLEELGRRWNFRTEILPKMVLRRMIVSSSQIRSLIELGAISLANRLLGQPFSIRGRVAPGLGIGRSQTVPTLNLEPYAELLPARGVYITWARLGSDNGSSQLSTALGRPLRSVTNVGRRPTFGERDLGVETHLLEPCEGSPPTVLDISFLYRLRDERKFDSAELLREQILRDIQRAQTYFRRLERARIQLIPPW